MANLIIRRLLLLIPTLCLILLGTYVMSTFVPGDEVSIRLEMAGESSNINELEYHRSYGALEQDLGLSGALFYVAVVPDYFPEDPYVIVPKSHRQTLINLNKKVRDWNAVLGYNQAMSELKEKIKGVSEYRELSILLSRVLRQDNITDIQSMMTGVANNYLDQSIHTSLSELSQIVNQMGDRSGFYVPSVRWHGIDNQFHRWMERLFSKENVSLRDGVGVLKKIGDSITWTFSLSFLTLVIACILAIAIAVWLVGNEGTVLANIVNGVLYFFYAIPLFWLATMGVIFLTTPDYGNWTHVFPSVGIRYWELKGQFWADIGIYAKQLLLPLICMVMVSLSYLTRQLTSDMRQQQHRLYATVAKAKGVKSVRMRWQHLLPNSLMPFITVVTNALPRTIVGSAVIEYIFSIPGVGKLLLDSIYFGDWPVIFMIILMVGVLTIISYLLADLMYAYFYPHTTKDIAGS